ncbi:hypothetical protein RJ639_000542 [Escallonia herrerae]|uniref:BZIP domain-containing protein n=1 Tax=Escallonia herrerae TaxID=1293975 RepID=A0AA89BK05_9ASTE|nr:hypothetical protein RJ639_000542 [Escallonia herrerae]
MDPTFAGKPMPAPYPSSRTDIDQMPDTPNRRAAHHRRAQSETFFRFPDDILLDDVVADFDLASLSPMVSDSSDGPRPRPAGPGPSAHFRSLSVDADFFDGLGLDGEGEKRGVGQGQEQGQGHRHRSNSMDGSSATTSFDVELMVDSAKKALGPDRLAELSLIDPKRAKRILANRQSAARSKERKIRYTGELERKVQTLQTEATTLSAQVTMLQRDTTGLTAENKELKLRLQAMEQQAHLRDALNETLRDEVQRLKIATGQIPAGNGHNFNRALPPQFSSHQFNHFSNHQAQQVQQQQQLQMPHSTPNNQTRSGQPQPSFLDFNHRA